MTFTQRIGLSLRVFTGLTLGLASVAVSAQSLNDLTTMQQAQAAQALGGGQGSQPMQQPPAQEQQPRADWRQGTYGMLPTREELAEMEASQVKPFGADLFEGGFSGMRSDGLNPEYRVTPGDQVTLRIWGAIDFERVLPVDAQGNIFIPTVGPVRVQGVSHRQLDSTVRAAVSEVYPGNVDVYTNLQGVQPVAVFVTGFVQNPGRYAGVPSDSILYFIDQANGIDEVLGSYRRVRLMRDGETLETMDIYDFLLEGSMSHSQLQDGDTIFVERRGPVVIGTGDVGRTYQYELIEEGERGVLLTDLAQLKPGVSHALVRGIRNNEPFSRYHRLADFKDLPLENGYEILFQQDERSENIVVQIEGAYLSESFFVLPKDATLHELLNSIAINPRETAYESISIRRESVAERQREALEESLRRLEMTYLGASSATAEEAAIRVREAELISQFVIRAREVEPNGRLVVADNNQIVDIRLQDGDVITLPERTDSILVSGEVYVPQSTVYQRNKRVRDYIANAGGLTDRADDKRILIVRQNGEVRYSDEVDLRPGDEILVLPKVQSKNLQLVSAVTQILYQIAVTTRIALDL